MPPLRITIDNLQNMLPSNLFKFLISKVFEIGPIKNYLIQY